MSYGKLKLDKTFEVATDLKIQCYYQNTSYGFRHVAVLEKSYAAIEQAKCCYYNRTWEAYEYESVLKKLIEKVEESKELPKAEIDVLKLFVKDPQRSEDDINQSGLKMASMVAKLGDVLTDTPKDANNWKKRMLKTQSGVDFPDDFDSLPEEEKAKRLNNAINV